MKPSAIISFLIILAACDAGPHVVVRASLQGRPVADLPVTLLPYDRDGLQDSLRREAGDDAPTLSQEVLRRLAGVDSALARPAADSAALARADSLRQERARLTARLDSGRQRIARWEERLRTRADSLGRRDAEQAERGASIDTTDAMGRAVLAASPGQSWARARYVLPDAIMEWNVPVTLPAGQDSVVLELNERNGRKQ